MPSVTFLVSVDIPDVTPDALLLDAEDIHDALDRAGLTVLSVVPWARATMPLAAPAGGFSSLSNPLGGTPPPAAPIA